METNIATVVVEKENSPINMSKLHDVAVIMRDIREIGQTDAKGISRSIDAIGLEELKSLVEKLEVLLPEEK